MLSMLVLFLVIYSFIFFAIFGFFCKKNSYKVSRFISYRLLRIVYRIGSFGKWIVTPLISLKTILHKQANASSFSHQTRWKKYEWPSTINYLFFSLFDTLWTWLLLIYRISLLILITLQSLSHCDFNAKVIMMWI